MSADIQILLLSEPAGFPGRKMRDCIQVFSLQTLWWPEHTDQSPFTVLLSRLPIPSSLNRIVHAALILAFYCRSSYKVGCKTALTFLVSFLHTSYVRRVIRITEKNKVLIHTLHVPTAECTASGSEFCGRKKRQSPRSSCALANRGATLVFLFVCFVFKINSGVFILCCVLLNLWWLAQNT